MERIKNNCLELQLAVMTLRMIHTMIINIFVKLRVFVWAISIFLISGLVQYIFITTYNLYNPHWVDWAQESKSGMQVEAFVLPNAKLTYPSIDEDKDVLYVGTFIERDKRGIVVSTPGIKHEEYTQRRHRLMRVLSQTRYGKKFENHVVLLSAATPKTMSNDVTYPFHQDVDFLYLTGVNEPDAMLALEYNRTLDRTIFMLFVKPNDPKQAQWDGPVIGVSAAMAYFKADAAYPISAFDTIIKKRYNNGKYCIWYKQNDQDKMRNDSAISNLVTSTKFKKAGQHPIEYNLQLLRLIKSDAEARIMKKSAAVSSQAFLKVMKKTKVGLPEAHAHAQFEYECRSSGAQHVSFPPIVAGGNHANTLHYMNNSDILRDNDLVLVDGGCEYNGYPSDITRTWPVNGKFTPPQKQLYQIVLDVQKACLKECKPGVSLDHIYQVMLLSLGKQLQGIGFIGRNESSEKELKKIAGEYCPHPVGHYLGMDTHDTPLIHRGLPLQTGIAFTLEPGIYIPLNAEHVPQKYRGIGIRIEDDVLLTNSGPYVLTGDLPKEIDDIEMLLAGDESKIQYNSTS